MPPPLQRRPSTFVTVSVLREMMDYAQAPVETLIMRNRRREVMDIRRAACWTLHRCGYTVMEIADILRRDHSTICHHIQTTIDIIQVDNLYRLYCEGMLIAAERGLSSHGIERPERGRLHLYRGQRA